MIKVNFLNNYKKRIFSAKFVKYVCEYVFKELNIEKVEVTVVLCKNDEIKDYNKKFRGKDYPTDVLSFPYNEKNGRYVYLGDVIISLDKVYSQSYEYGVEPIDEFVRLLVHGILHLLGYDHETSQEDEKVMMELQDKLVDKILVSFKKF